ncbi:MAG: NUDIX domain-containing protein, partial [Gemmatimonadetes bacterium]|nr:NUDIX domain-containing protein [Gemmatimonadota bacterium]NIQ57691.1 NUDIX domain-containing protein [Gemmatimonadota bacterium]NIU77858.1 NUDIX domain-containing protein [Gammaproteobacteria bacterium]NIX46974.1 NUDIX domain-containing protein [Gemmatimonadota bacterium]NIY11332.1 NUDIX domain-containing protein [Gemmatimonadota bacterium]
CCSHPRPGESVEAAAHRRLAEELGFDCPFEPAGSILYRAEVGGGLVEHEYDHLLLGRWDGTPEPDPDEVAGWRWVALDDLRDELARAPSRFTYWFKAAFRELDDRGRLPTGEPAGPRVA